MVINIIHNPERSDRYALLQKEVETQGLEVKYWPAIIHPTIVFAGVAKAHKQIVLHAHHANLPETCIGEDDLKFFAPGAWQFFLDNKPEDFDLYLGGVMSGVLDENDVVPDFRGMTLYIIHQRFYDTFLRLTDFNNIDYSLSQVKGKYVVCNPFVVTQHGGYSDNKKIIKESYDEHLEGRKLFGVTLK